MDIPILFLTFNRLEETKRVFSSIRAQQPKKLYVVSDGARADRSGEDVLVEQVRDYIRREIDWECEVFYDFAVENMGCGKRVSSGISWFFDHEEMGVILEDDCLPDPSFFVFCAELLNRYKDDSQVGVISGNSYVPRSKCGEHSYYFSSLFNCWGWATWRRVWKNYDFNMTSWKNNRTAGWLKKNVGGSLGRRELVACNFDKVASGEIDTWDYQLSYALLDSQFLNVAPSVDLVENIGFNENATHTLGEQKAALTANRMEFPLRHPKQKEVLISADDHVYSELRGEMTLLGVLRYRAKRLFGRV